MIASIKGALYIAMTWNVTSRIEQHKLGTVKGFSSKYLTNMLAWCEVAESFEAAHNRDAEIKGW